MPNLNDLVNYLTRKKIYFRQIDEMQVIFELKFFSDNGKANREELVCCQKDNVLQVRATNKRYPELCPNRHINLNGWFCLGLVEELKDLTIEEWIQNVKAFLDAQYQCEIKGVWPRDVKEWAHGDGAIYQKIIEQYYEQFKHNLLSVTLDQLTVVEIDSSNENKDKIYHVYIDRELILVGNEDKVFNKRYTCICDNHGIKKHRSIGKCPQDCAKVIFMVAVNDYLLNKAEKEFWDYFRSANFKCCNTMEKCELNV